jgi:ketosteroid isomerase-like protein
MCYLNRTYHVLPTVAYITLDTCRGADHNSLPGGSMRSIALFLVVLAASSTVSYAFTRKGVCREKDIKASEVNKDPNAIAESIYFFSWALEKPVVGKEQFYEAFAQTMGNLKNHKHAPEHMDRLVVAGSGDMAYEYGSTQVSFDERGSRTHIAFSAAYLRVWRAIGGECKIVAEMYKPEGNRQ